MSSMRPSGVRWNDARHALRRRAEGERGFTLVELVVVVVIMAILAAVAVPVYLNQRRAAWDSAARSDVHNASTVLEGVMANHADPLSRLANSCADVTGSACAVDGDAVNVTDGVNLKVELNDRSYTITGRNTSDAKCRTYVYDSATGRLTVKQ